MLCQKCNKNEATGIIKQTINGKTNELYLCPLCLKEFGIFQPGGITGELDIGKFFGGFFNMFPPSAIPAANHTPAGKCRSCGATLHDFMSTGKAGCPECYTSFYDGLVPILQRIHGTSTHKGKFPKTASPEIGRKRELSELKLELTKAISEQEFEKAAVLRDKIKLIENVDKNIQEGESKI